MKVEWSPEYGELVEVSDDGRNWSKAYYVGNLIDRSKKYMTVEKKVEVYMFTCDYIRKVDLWPKMRKYEEVKYRAYKDASEAVEALGRKAIIGWCTVYGHKKPDVRCIFLAKDGFRLFINGSYRTYSFDRAFKELKFEDGTPLGVKL